MRLFIDRKVPCVLVLAQFSNDATEAAQNLGLRNWISPQVHGAGAEHGLVNWSGIVYVDGWTEAATPVLRVAHLVARARHGGAVVETEQHRSAWFYRGEAVARRAQAVLDAQRTARQPTIPTMVAPEAIVSGHAYTVRRRWWHRITDWLY